MGFIVKQTKQNGDACSSEQMSAIHALAFAKRCEKDAERRSIDEITIVDTETGGCVWYACTSMFEYFVTLTGVHQFFCESRSEVVSVLTDHANGMAVEEFSCQIRTEPYYGSQNYMFEMFVGDIADDD